MTDATHGTARTFGPPIVQLRDAAVGYGGIAVQSRLTFEVRRGEIVVVGGGSGCGKSTLMRCLVTLNPPVSGDVQVAGVRLPTDDEAALQSLRRRIGVMYQSGALFGGQTLLQNVRLPLEEFTDLPDAAMDAAAMAKLSLVGLADSALKLPSEISGGMCKRAAIARAMALDPEVLFLDEPSAGLDPITSADLDALILRLNRMLGTTFVVISHELPSIFAIADRFIMLDRDAGTMVASGPPAELRDRSPDPKVRSFMNRAPSDRPSDSTETRP
jgi:phospholipid/cholesterol/gamma-HCH transport system ATP-binding protein